MWETLICCLSYVPQPGAGRTRPATQACAIIRTEPVTFCFAGQCPTNWAPLVRARQNFKKKKNRLLVQTRQNVPISTSSLLCTTIKPGNGTRDNQRRALKCGKRRRMGGGSRPEKQYMHLLRKGGPRHGISQPPLAAEGHPGWQSHSYPMEQ